jgi:hypothetical protein
MGSWELFISVHRITTRLLQDSMVLTIKRIIIESCNNLVVIL